MPAFIGIDIAKSSFDADVHGTIRHFDNNDIGAKALMKATDADSVYIIEATGNYSVGLADALCAAGRRVKLINPLSAKRFAQLKLKRTKTDPIDAHLLSQYGQIASEPDYEPLGDDASAAKQDQSVLEQFKKMKTSLLNQLEALLQLPRPAPEAVKALRQHIKSVDKTIDDLSRHVRTRCVSAFPGMIERLETIPGIGPVISSTLVVATDGFARFEDPKQVVSYVGACPTQYQSGSSVRGHGSISRMCDPTVRNKCYMGALAAKRSQNEFRAFYTHLRDAGKPHKVAMMGVINKMLRVAFAVAKHDTVYQPNYSSQTSLVP